MIVTFLQISHKPQHRPQTWLYLRKPNETSISTIYCAYRTHTHIHTFNGLFARTTWVSWHQKGKPFCILLKQEMMGGSGISWTICKSFAPHSRQITTPVPHHSIFYGPDALPDAQPTVSKHWRRTEILSIFHAWFKHISVQKNTPFCQLKPLGTKNAQTAPSPLGTWTSI